MCHRCRGEKYPSSDSDLEQVMPQKFIRELHRHGSAALLIQSLRDQHGIVGWDDRFREWYAVSPKEWEGVMHVAKLQAVPVEDPELERLLREEEEIERRIHGGIHQFTQTINTAAAGMKKAWTGKISLTRLDDTRPSVLRSAVFTALDNGQRNGYHCSDPYTEAVDLIRYDKGLEDYAPEDLAPIVAEWLSYNR